MKDLNKYRNYLFLALLVVLYFVLDYHTILFLHPQGIHFIRQTDCLSFVANYYKNGFHFFQPQVFSLHSTDGKAACEFPILYYFTSLLYLVFNEHEFFLRLITIIIASAGFLYLFKLLYSFLQDLVFAIGFSFLFISSTVLLYYTNNFLPDASSLGLAFMGWYFYFVYFRNRSNRNVAIVCFVLFAISSLLKVTYLINPIAAILSIVTFDYLENRNITTTVRGNSLPIISFVGLFIIVAAWNFYVNYYNRINNDNYFLIQSRPIWNLDRTQVSIVFDYIWNHWYTKYYFQSTMHTFLFLVIAGFLFIKRSARMILIPSVWLLIGTIAYFLLFFAQFKDHDYYFIAFIPAIVLVIVNSFIGLRNRFPKLINNYITKSFLIILCLLSINYARGKLALRYNISENNFVSLGYNLSETRQYLDSVGVSTNAKFIIIGDITPNAGLYFINRHGWSIGDTTKASLSNIERFIGTGAEYILLTDKRYAQNLDFGTKISEKSGVLVFKIKKRS